MRTGIVVVERGGEQSVLVGPVRASEAKEAFAELRRANLEAKDGAFDKAFLWYSDSGIAQSFRRQSVSAEDSSDDDKQQEESKQAKPGKVKQAKPGKVKQAKPGK